MRHFLPDRPNLLAGAVKGSFVALWDTVTGQERLTFRESPYDVRCLAISPDGQTVVTGGSRYDEQAKKSWSELKLWDVRSGKLEEVKTPVGVR